MIGYRRADGSAGIRNVVAVVYLVECARHVATRIAEPFGATLAQVIGFGGCFRNDYATRMMERLCTHPNVGAVMLVSLGCEGFDRKGLEAVIAASGRPVTTLTIQDNGGTATSIRSGETWVRETIEQLEKEPTVNLELSDLVIGTVCGGSDSFSGITANPAVGLVFDHLVEAGGTAIFEETGELIGCEPLLRSRATSHRVGEALAKSVEKAGRYYETMGQPSFAPGNADGGLTTIEEKSVGAYLKSGSGPIHGLIRPGDAPPAAGLYLLDVVPDGDPKWGFPNINDNAEIAEMMACGAHMILFTTGRGSVVGSALAPVVKVCANPETYARLADDMDIDAGRVVNTGEELSTIRDEILDSIERTASGEATASERLGHVEFVLTYKSFDQIRPICHPSNA